MARALQDTQGGGTLQDTQGAEHCRIHREAGHCRMHREAEHCRTHRKAEHCRTHRKAHPSRLFLSELFWSVCDVWDRDCLVSRGPGGDYSLHNCSIPIL